MTQETSELLESVIRITQERDKKLLETALVETLADSIEADAIYLLHQHSDGESMEVAAGAPDNAPRIGLEPLTGEPGEKRMRRDPQLARCVSGREFVRDTRNGKARYLFPVSINRKVSGVLVVCGSEASDEQFALIRGFLRIYENFLGVLSDNERDALTGLLNRRTFDACIADLISSSLENPISAAPDGAERRKTGKLTSHWLGMLDIDHFKKINDTYGHVYGDEVLLLFSGLMKKSFRHTDLLFRFGGEEFVVVLAPADESDAFMIFERFRQRLAAFEFPQVGRATVSIGMTRIHARDHSATVVEHADQALYYAKENGRNQTFNYHQLLERGILKERRYETDVEIF